MATFSKFAGINNILPPERLKAGELVEALDMDVDLSGACRRRPGYTRLVADPHRNVFEGPGFLLTTVNGDLVTRDGAGVERVVYPGLSDDRVWYLALPDGRVAFSNGLICGLASATAATGWGVPVPDSIGALTSVPGQLAPGDYQWQITYVRQSDGLEGGPQYSNPVPVPDGGVVLTGLPVRTGYDINVYLSSVNGGTAYLAGRTSGGAFSYTGPNSALTTPCRTEFLEPAPAGRLLAHWKGRALIAEGRTLWASKFNQPELFDKRRDFKQFSAPITLVQPVDDGIYVGTAQELAFLAGETFEQMAYRQCAAMPVVLGSGAEVRGELLLHGNQPGNGRAMVCICGGILLAGFNSGVMHRLSEGRYATAVGEVAATFRMNAGIPQYVAIPQ